MKVKNGRFWFEHLTIITFLIGPQRGVLVLRAQGDLRGNSPKKVPQG